MDSFIEGFWLGVGASVPIGPINIMIMQEALKRYSSAFAIGLGAMSADISYLILILLGVKWFFNNDMFTFIVGLFGSIFMLYMAWSIFNSSKEPIVDCVEVDPLDKKALHSNWIKGYLMTLLNPYTMLFWLSLSAYISAKGLNPLYTILGLISSITLWITLMPLIIYRSRHLISNRVAKILSIISATILLFFAISMLLSILN